MPSSGNAGASGVPENTGGNPESVSSKFNGVVHRAKAALLWERLWPRLVPPLSVTGLFASASWLGAWSPLPPEARIAGVVAFAAALVASPFLWKTKSLNVTADDAVKRIDNITGTPRREAEQFHDKLPAGSSADDRAILDLHRESIWEKWGDKFKAGSPHPGVDARDPHRLRYAIALLTLATAAVANQHAIERIDKAFDWHHPPAAVAKLPPVEVKAWVTPPEGISDPPPLYLTQATKDDAQGGDKLLAHKNSTLTILTFESDVTVSVNGQDVPTKTIGTNTGTQDKPTFRHEVTLAEGTATVSIRKGTGQRLDWHFQVLPDDSPSATINGVGKNDKDPNTLDLNYKRKDDYGVTGSTVKITPVPTLDPGAKPLPSAKLPEIKLP